MFAAETIEMLDPVFRLLSQKGYLYIEEADCSHDVSLNPFYYIYR